MKKLFTLFAAAALAMSANAIIVVDAEVDFSKEETLKLYSWGGSFSQTGGDKATVASVDLKDGCFHFCSTDTVDPGWAVQFFPFGGFPVEEGVEYTVTYSVKGTPAAEGMSLFAEGFPEYGTFSFTEEFQEKSFTFVATEDKESQAIQAQCGSFVGEWWIQYFKVTHEKDESAVEIALDIPVVQNAFSVTNGGADEEFDQSIAFDDFDAFPTVCAWGKEDNGNPHPAFVEDGAFVVHATTMTANPWDNQFWFCLPCKLGKGDTFTISFKYKATAAASVGTQAHANPSDYNHWACIGNIGFTTEWQEFSTELTLDGSMAPADKGFYSIALNLNDYAEANDYYFDDIVIEGIQTVITEEEGLFIATDVNPAPVNFADEVVEFDGEEFTGITVGTEAEPVRGIWLSKKTGSVDLYKANSLVLAEDKEVEDYLEDFTKYSVGKGAPVTLPTPGIWNILVDDDYMMFVLAGEAEPVLPEIVVEATAKLADPWDNQFWIVANRTLAAGEETHISFEYKADAAAKSGTQCHKAPGDYLHWMAIGDVNFAEDWKTLDQTFVIPAEADGMQSIAFNLNEYAEANNYHFRNFVWTVGEESLIVNGDLTGDDFSSFVQKINQGEIVPSTGIEEINVDSKNVVVYNLNGQRVENVKGLVIKNGKIMFVK